MGRKKKIVIPRKRNKSFYSDLKWCIDNDWQVYIVPTLDKFCRIAIRKGGITTEGKDYKYIDGVRYTSQEHLGSVEYKSQKQAQAELPYVYEKIRQKYGQ
tara:strand:+ start:5978 stop:6277 length:300 start_codon:yes stop_codon:yes gene_type:complete